MGRQGEIRERIRASLEKYISASGYTQKEIAEKLGVSKSSITNWLKGKNSPDANLVMPICKLLNITVGQFYGEDEAFEEKSDTTKKENAPSVSEEAMKLAMDYDGFMDDRGRETVRGVADLEIARYKVAATQAHNPTPPPLAEEVTYYITSFFYHPSSAGTGEMADAEEPESLHLIKKPPRGTSFVVPVSGNSMEPTNHNGDKLFIRAQEEIMPGQIGIFFMDGHQWVKELGDGVLISHNQDYAPRQFTEDIRCQGLVLGVCDDSYFED